jgi:hypothetical protein
MRGVISGNPERLEVHSKRHAHNFQPSMVLRRYRSVQHNAEQKALIHVTVVIVEFEGMLGGEVQVITSKVFRSPQ